MPWLVLVLCVFACVKESVCECVHASLCAIFCLSIQCVRVCVHACVRVCVCVLSVSCDKVQRGLFLSDLSFLPSRTDGPLIPGVSTSDMRLNSLERGSTSPASKAEKPLDRNKCYYIAAVPGTRTTHTCIMDHTG
jgi:hypothetical protein